MKLDVTGILRQVGTEVPFRAEQAIAPQKIGGDTVTFDPAILTGKLMALEDDSIHCEGVLTTTAHGQCAKCLDAAEAPIRAEFEETFLRDGDPEDAEIFAYAGSCIDFERLALTCTMLAMPMRLLCKPDCSGIAGFEVGDAEAFIRCQSEGQEATREHPFAALQQLLTKDEEV